METLNKQCIAENLFPKQFVNDVLYQKKEQFLNRLGETKLLVFRLQNPDDNLIPDLFTENTTNIQPQEIHFKYRTSTGSTDHQESLWKMPLIGQEELRIRHALLEGPHFVAPLKKHKRSGQRLPDRITVGRARNQDLVIDHTSVSKIQAWFEIDNRGEFYLSDAGSTNGTYVNSRLIIPRQRVQLQAGDNIRFATIESLFCSPETLWQVLHPQECNQKNSSQ